MSENVNKMKRQIYLCRPAAATNLLSGVTSSLFTCCTTHTHRSSTAVPSVYNKFFWPTLDAGRSGSRRHRGGARTLPSGHSHPWRRQCSLPQPLCVPESATRCSVSYRLISNYRAPSTAVRACAIYFESNSQVNEKSCKLNTGMV